jgi:predicted acyltransferase
MKGIAFCENIQEKRVLSIDLFRGVAMFLLIGGVTGLYDLLLVPQFKGTLIYALGLQFQHHPWEGLTLWDLGHPFFLFISGAAMVFSYGRRWEKGESWRATLGRAV